ncbi:MAG: glycosyltransferase [Fibrobacteres bacterium]|nr:glycosyltransferase [Fibrobacterota bacterium]
METAKIKRFRADFFGSVAVVLTMVAHVLSRGRRLWKLRKLYKNRTGDPQFPRVLMVGDNMDGTHGISVSAERLVRQLRAVGIEAWVLGVSHSENPAGNRDQEGWVRMLRPHCVQDMFGYEGKELALPDMDAYLEFLETNRIDLLEIETPGFMGILSLLTARWIRVPIIQNYRTDLLAYTRLLLDNDVFISLLRWWICGFLRFGGANVIVPSQDFVEQVQKMGVARHKIHFLVRGVDLDRFSPEKRDGEVWRELAAPEGPVISYLGRVSREKGLEVLAEAFEKVLVSRPDAVLCVIGDGPWKEAFRSRMAPNGRAVFTGELGAIPFRACWPPRMSLPFPPRPTPSATPSWRLWLAESRPWSPTKVGRKRSSNTTFPDWWCLEKTPRLWPKRSCDSWITPTCACDWARAESCAPGAFHRWFRGMNTSGSTGRCMPRLRRRAPEAEEAGHFLVNGNVAGEVCLWYLERSRYDSFHFSQPTGFSNAQVVHFRRHRGDRRCLGSFLVPQS